MMKLSFLLVLTFIISQQSFATMLTVKTKCGAGFPIRCNGNFSFDSKANSKIIDSVKCTYTQITNTINNGDSKNFNGFKFALTGNTFTITDKFFSSYILKIDPMNEKVFYKNISISQLTLCEGIVVPGSLL